MKFARINAFLSESFKDIINRRGLNQGQIDMIKAVYTDNPHLPLDRFLNKYGDWLAKNMSDNPLENNYGLPVNIREMIDKWERFRLGDINQLDPTQVMERIQAYEDEHREASMRTHTGHHGTTEYSAYERKKQKQAMAKALPSDADTRVLSQNEMFTTRLIKTYKGSVKYGCDQAKGPGWCVSRSDTDAHWKSYLEQGQRFVFVDFGSTDKVEDMITKATGTKPLPRDRIQRFIAMDRVVGLHPKHSDEQLRAQLEKLMNHPDQEYRDIFEANYKLLQKKYAEMTGIKGNPSEYVKMALRFTKEGGTGNPKLQDVWNMHDKSNTSMGVLLAKAVLSDPETAKALHSIGFTWDPIDISNYRGV